ncbi:nuA3 HAT complex component nto1 [Linnemannia gamsii]|uniref:NuA3 HAT complex component nto1 n=1 Tax=Linnemannia gamsii TaxID=64522 RepID=A0ABQ7K4P5_9FUNG|nr:nuA3 HAT complex component nto1 [Linnemannia gamsii]
MPHQNSSSPPLPRLQPPESDEWYAKVKAVPHSSPVFTCILPGCANSYQTKQGLERHFMSIHMPKPNVKPIAPSPQTASSTSPSGSTNSTDHTALRSGNSNSTGSRKGRIKSHRIGRPPGSGLKARLEQEAIQRALDRVLAEEQENRQKHQQQQHQQQQEKDPHVNHSLLASHPASTRQDYANDEENKPREERSYLEFFPYLTTTVRLEIVDPSDTESTAMVGIEDAHTTPSEASTSVDIKASPVETVPSLTQMETETAASTQLTTAVEHPTVSEPSTHQDPVEAASEETLPKAQDLLDVTMESAGVSNDLLQPSDDDMDADGATSDREVFFDAKGFVEGEAEDTQKSNSAVPKDNGFSELVEPTITATENSEIKVESDDMDVDTDPKETKETNESTPHTAPLEPTTLAHTTVEEHRDENTSAVPSVQETELKPVQQTTRQPKAAAHAAVLPTIKITIPVPPPLSSTLVLEPKTPLTLLPKSTFRLIPREEDDLEEYHLPTTHNVRYIEPTETELAERVEYDMDEQDEIWLREVNTQRRKQDLSEVTSTTFEKIFDRLEKEWFDLTKNIPKPTENLPPEDSACNICDDGECENSNAIVFCDGCNLAVHQDCYGIPYIPEGQWLCRKCMLSPQMPVSCIFCPGEGGAFKQTNTSRWAHLLCASWIPEVGVANVVYMEPIDNIEKIPSSRWKLTCYICKLRMGACIQCETKNCVRAFHVTCARKAHLYMKSKLSKVSNSGGEVLVYRAHCHKHTPRDYKGSIDIAGAAVAVIANKGLKKKRVKIRALDDDSDDLDYGRSDSEETVDRRLTSTGNDKGATSGLASSQSLGGSRTSKAALAHQKHYTPGAPLAPMMIVNRLLPFVSKLTAKGSGQKKVSAQNFLYNICKYWSLKRESRRGAPLLKRLHLEPWTASASAHRQTEEEKTKKLQTQLLLRGDLEKVRMLAELVRKRERAKLKRQELQNRYLSKIMFPLKTILEDTLIELEKLDRQKYFAYPISAEEVQDYHDVIKNPISFQTINEKLVAHKYQSVDEFSINVLTSYYMSKLGFQDDVRLIYENCMTYNNVDTPYYRSAIRQSKQGEPLLEKAKEDYESLDIDPRTGFLAVPIDQDIFSYSLVPFQKSDDDEENHTQIVNQPVSHLPNAADTPSPKRKQKHKEPTTEPRRTLRGTPGRGSQGSSQPSTPNGDAKPSSPTADQSPGLRTPVRITAPVRTAATVRTTAPVRTIAPARAAAPARIGALVRTGFKPEAPKLKTATLTRADMVRAREQTGERVELEAEDELLEKLKLKSKKSRTLANSLQSRLKPSIVDKAVVINKKAPKGWAYVVVEGEEDTTEGEDGDDEEQAPSTRASSLAPGQSLPDPLEAEDPEAARLEAIKEALREENRRKSREKASLKKLAQEAKIKDRAEKYQIHKAEKARLQAETLARRARGEETSEDEAEKKEGSKPVATRSRRGAGKISVDASPPAPDQDAQTKPKSQPGSPSETKPQANGGQKSSGSSPRDETAESSAGKRKAGTPEETEQQQESSEKSTELSHKPATKRNSVSERPSKAKRRAHGDVEKHRLEEDEDANGGDKGEESDSAERSEESEAVQTKEEPPRKRQKKAALGRSSPPEEPEDESGAGNPRRLRSQEVTPQALSATALGPRRSSLASPRGGSTKGSVDSTSGENQHQHPSAV